MGFSGHRNPFLLMNIQAHLLFIWAWTRYTLRVICASALFVKGGFESGGPTGRACRWDSGLTQKPSPGQLMSEVARAGTEFCLTAWRAPSCLAIPRSWAVHVKSGSYQDEMLDLWGFHSFNSALVFDLESYWRQIFSKCNSDNCFPSWHVLRNMMNHQNRCDQQMGKQKWGRAGRVSGRAPHQSGARVGWTSSRDSDSLSASHIESITRDGKVSQALIMPSCTDFKTKLNPLPASEELPSFLSKPQK